MSCMGYALRPSAWGGRRSLCPLQDLDQAPALGLRQRSGLDDAHRVALAGLVALVVSVESARAAHHLLVSRMTPRDVDPHGDRLFALVGDDDALPGLRGDRLPLRFRSSSLCGPALLRRGPFLSPFPSLGLPPRNTLGSS